MENEEVKLSKFEKVKRATRKIFPHFFTEMIAIVAVFSFAWISSNVFNTATAGQEIEVMYHVSETPELMQQVPVETEPSDIEETSEVITEPSTDQEVTIEYQINQMCFVGGNRVSTMKDSVLTTSSFILNDNSSTSWLANDAMLAFEEIQEQINLVIVCAEIENMQETDSFINALNELPNRYPDKIFICSNIGPVNEVSALMSNSSIEAFNARLASELNNSWQILNLYDYLAANEFRTTTDGIVYEISTATKAFAWMVDSIKVQTVSIKQ